MKLLFKKTVGQIHAAMYMTGNKGVGVGVFQKMILNAKNKN